MTLKPSLMGGAAFGVLIALGSGLQVQAAAAHHKKALHPHPAHEARADGTAAEIRELKDEVRALEARLDAQAADTSQTQAQVQQAQATAQAAQQEIQTAQDQDADATAAVIQSIPTQVASAVDAAKPKTDAFYYKGIKITPGGFLEAASIYRSKSLASDIASPFNSIPFASSKTGHEDETKFSERQSRVSFLAQGNVTPDMQLGMYGEFDFQGGAQTANYNESNSFNPRVRHLYGTVDWTDSGWHLLAGQNWSLATLNAKGITPRNEVTPPQIDAQYVPGFVWTRQPQVRLTKDFGKTLWLAVSVENPETTFTGSVPATVTSLIANGSGIYSGPSGSTAPAAAGGGTAAIPTTATQSLNHLPDVVAKAAYEANIYGRSIHAEVFGIGRAFTDRIGTASNTVYGGGIGVGLIVPVLPGLLDAQASGLSGKGIGRYGSSQLPDVTFRSDGRIEPIQETDFLVGATLHPTKMLDIYAFGGEEKEQRQAYNAVGNPFGYSTSAYSNAGCYTEGGSCSAVARFVQQGTIGFWDRIYQGPFGRLQFGVQYSYTERHSFADLARRQPLASDNMIFTSLRYYPF